MKDIHIIHIGSMAGHRIDVVSSASVGLAGNERQTKSRKRVSHQGTYYHNKVATRDTQIQWAPVGKPPGFTEG